MLLAWLLRKVLWAPQIQSPWIRAFWIPRRLVIGLLAATYGFFAANFIAIAAQEEPVYLEKYTISKIYFEGSGDLNRYYIFRFLQFKEGDTFSPRELQQHIFDTERALRTQWYFQATFDPRYYTDGRVEIYVLLQPTPRRLAFMGGTEDGHSVRIGFIGQRRSPGSAVSATLGKVVGFSLYFPYLGNTMLGLEFLAEAQILNLFERLDINSLGQQGFWMRGGIKEFIQPQIGIRLGLAQEFWGTFQLSTSAFLFDVMLGAYAQLNGLHYLQSRHWGMSFWLRADAGVLNGLLLLRGRYDIALLPWRWLELNLQISAIANVFGSLDIGTLDTETPGVDVLASPHDFNALGRLRPIFLLSHNDYDNRTEFNLGLAIEAKFGLYLSVFNTTVSEPDGFGMEVQGGLVFDVLTPGSFTTRFMFLTGFDILQGVPVAEFLVESRF